MKTLNVVQQYYFEVGETAKSFAVDSFKIVLACVHCGCLEISACFPLWQHNIYFMVNVLVIFAMITTGKISNVVPTSRLASRH